MQLPFSLKTLSSPYGDRRHPRTGRKSFHLGADFKVPDGTPVRAIDPGVVADKRFSPTEGNTVTILHPDQVRSKYKHLRDPSPLRKGAKVAQGQRIGKAGATGSTAFGSHLHLEVWVKGQHVDPIAYITRSEPA